MANNVDTGSNLPLQPELQLVQYLNSLWNGNSNSLKGMNPTTVTAQQVPQLTSQDLQGIMTEFLRGNGNFLESMRQQNTSGLYNSSTRSLMANDLQAQAALKAATAQQGIAGQNAQLAQSAQNTNAQLAQALQIAKIQAAAQANSPSKAQLAAAAGINALQKLMGGNSGGKKPTAKKSSEQGQSSDDGFFSGAMDWLASFNQPSLMEQVTEANAVPQMSFAPDSIQSLEAFQMPQMSTVDNPYFSSDYLSSGNFGGIFGEEAFQPVDWSYGDIPTVDYSMPELPAFDYTNFDSTPADYELGDTYNYDENSYDWGASDYTDYTDYSQDYSEDYQTDLSDWYF